MNEVNPSEIEVETQTHQVPWEEQFEDHENKIEEYIQNCIFRGCSVEGTVRRKAELQNNLSPHGDCRRNSPCRL